MMGRKEMVGGQAPKTVIGSTLLTTIIEGRSPIRTIIIGHPQDIMANNKDIRVATKTIPQGGLASK